MRVLPDARLQVVTPCRPHHRYEAHGDCRAAPAFTITLEYDKPLATVDCGTEIVEISAEQVIFQAFAALPDPPMSKHKGCAYSYVVCHQKGCKPAELCPGGHIVYRNWTGGGHHHKEDGDE